MLLKGGGTSASHEKSQRRLSFRLVADEERLTALKYVVHLEGDAHQPLHAGYGDDKGGNTCQVRWDGRGSNLHHVWDTGMIETFELDSSALAKQIELTQHVTSGGGSSVTRTSIRLGRFRSATCKRGAQWSSSV